MSEQEQATEQQPIFSIEKLYVKDLSLETPHAPSIFLQNEQPEIDIRVSTDHTQIEDEFYNVTVTVTVTAKLPDDKVVFLTEVSQCGIFRIVNIPEEDMRFLLAVSAPNLLYPYVREVVSSSITHAGFPAVLLAPINFEAMFQAQQTEGGNA